MTTQLQVIAFDCFGTVFDMRGFAEDEIRAYGSHIAKPKWEPYEFPEAWFGLQAHPDAREGIHRLRSAGYRCVTLSNGTAKLISQLSSQNQIVWDRIIPLEKYRVYKPNPEAYLAVEQETGTKPANTMMVTANKDFGDLKHASNLGMTAQLIRYPGFPSTIVELAESLGG